jgi:two-component system, NtrC family, nitrogen regulation response regulator NtrX
VTRVLVVDDEPGIRAALVQLLEYEGLSARAVGSAAEGLRAYAEWHPAVTFLDVKMAGMDGLTALRTLRERDPEAVVVMISGHASIRDAIEATQLGAFDVLEKPLDTDRLLVTLRNALGTRDLRAENARLKATVDGRRTMVGEAPALQALRRQVDAVAPTPARVLITGENGTGKELVARALHTGSPRARKPFIEVNCAAIPSELIESELFGHVKGSFTGAVADRAGKFEQADGGTLFLDEIGDMALAAQAKVLRVLQEGELTRIGGSKALQGGRAGDRGHQQAAGGRDRGGALPRGPVLPPQRGAAARAAAARAPRGYAGAGRALRGAAVGARGRAARRSRPTRSPCCSGWTGRGNVRELRNTVERLLILTPGPVVTAADVERLTGARGSAGDGGLGVLTDCRTYEEFKDAAERAFLVAKLRAHDWNVAETARALDMPRSNLYKKIERHALTREAT